MVQSLLLVAPYSASLALSPDGKTLAVGELTSLQLWPIKDGKLFPTSLPYGHKGAINAMSFGACGNLLATLGQDESICLWDLDGSHPHFRLSHKSRDHKVWHTVALSPDGTKLAAGFKKGGFTIWNVSPNGLRVLAEHKAGASALTFTPDSKTLVVVNGTDSLKIIDLSEPSAISTELKTGQGHTYREVANSIPADRPRAVFLGPETIQEMKPLDVSTLAISSDGKSLALGGTGGIEIWRRTEQGWSRRTGFLYPSQYVQSMAFERSGKTLLAGSRLGNGEIRRFDVSAEKPVQLADAVVRDKPITTVAASSDGKFLVAADEGGHVLVWSANMAKKLHDWTFPGPVHSLAFAPDNRHLALGNGDGTVYILRLSPPGAAKEKSLSR